MKTLEDKINALTRPNIRLLKPYSSARDEAPKSERIQRIMLDANENSLGGPFEADYSRYPDPHQESLKQALSRMKGVESNQIFLGNGSDEAIDLLIRAFVEPGKDHIVLLPPTYGMYAVQANIQNVEIRTAPLRSDFSPDLEALRPVINEHSKLLFLCSPNNPSGQCLPKGFVQQMLAEFPGLVVLDEAYADFSGQDSWISHISEYPNLVVLQTLSKAWGLAGLRVGMAYSNPFVIQVLNKIKYPYNLNTVTVQLALEALSKQKTVSAKVNQILAEKHKLEAALPALSCVEKVFPSDANFILVRVKNADDLYRFLAENGIIVRNRSREWHCENCLRITVGSTDENEQLLATIRRYED